MFTLWMSLVAGLMAALSLRGSRVRADTLITSTDVGRGLRMGCPRGLDDARWQGCRSEYGDTYLLGVQTGGMIEVLGAVFNGKLILQGVEAGGDLPGSGPPIVMGWSWWIARSTDVFSSTEPSAMVPSSWTAPVSEATSDWGPVGMVRSASSALRLTVCSTLEHPV